MATIVANLIVKGDSLEGTLATLTISAPITVVPNARKSKEAEPDYRIISRSNGFELGAGWRKFAQSTGAEYVSVVLSAPEFGTRPEWPILLIAPGWRLRARMAQPALSPMPPPVWESGSRYFPRPR